MLAVLAGAYGCKTEEEIDPEKGQASAKVYPVHFFSNEIETKTVFGDSETTSAGTSYSTLWSANDSQIAVSLNLKDMRPASVTPSPDFKTATFDAVFPQSEVQAPYTFYALSPYSAAISATSTHGGYHFNILPEQTPLAASCDEGAQVLVASRGAASIADFDNVELQFSHVTAYGKLTLKEMDLPAGAAVRSVELTASVPLAGEYFYKYADGSLEERAASRTLILRTDNVTINSGTSEEIWFACAPADLGGGTLRVDVNTSKGVLSRTVSVAAGKLAFQAGRISKFAVNMSGAVFAPVLDRWVLVTDASTLSAGDEIIIANSAAEGAAYAISTDQTTDYRNRASVDIIRDADSQLIIENPSNSVETLKLVAGDHEGYFYLQEATSFTHANLYASNSDSDNKLLTGSDSQLALNNLNAFANWHIAVSASGAAFISTYGTVSSHYKQLRYNATGRVFNACQSSSQTAWDGAATGTEDVYVYRKEVGLALDQDPVLQKNDYGAYLLGGDHVYRRVFNQMSREYQDNGTVTFTIIAPSSHQIVEYAGIPVSPAKGDSFTLHFAQFDGRSRSETDYFVIVVKVDGPKVWLSDGSGNGFIVKK